MNNRQNLVLPVFNNEENCFLFFEVWINLLEIKPVLVVGRNVILLKNFAKFRIMCFGLKTSIAGKNSMGLNKANGPELGLGEKKLFYHNFLNEF